MKTKIATLLLATTLAATGANAADGAQKETGVGLGGGALLGAIAGGPIGAVVGAGLGVWLGDKVGDGRDLPVVEGELDSTSADLSATREELSLAKSRIHHLRGALSERDIRLAKAAQTVAAPDLADELARGLELEVLFRTGNTDLPESTRQRLDDLAEMLATVPGIRVRLDGYADPRGDEQFNVELSHARMESVRSALLSGGIAAERIAGFAHGEKNASSAEGDLDAYALERRVSITFLTGDHFETVASHATGHPHGQ